MLLQITSLFVAEQYSIASLHVITTSSLSIHLSMDTEIASVSRLL